MRVEAAASGEGRSQGAEDGKGHSLHPGQEERRKRLKHTFRPYAFRFSCWLGLLTFHVGKQTNYNILQWEWTHDRKSCHAWAVLQLSEATAASVGWAGGSAPSPLPVENSPPFQHNSRHQFAEEINISHRSEQQRSQFNATLSMSTYQVPEPPLVLLWSKITAKQNNNCNKHSSFQKGQI